MPTRAKGNIPYLVLYPDRSSTQYEYTQIWPRTARLTHSPPSLRVGNRAEVIYRLRLSMSKCPALQRANLPICRFMHAHYVLQQGSVVRWSGPSPTDECIRRVMFTVAQTIVKGAEEKCVMKFKMSAIIELTKRQAYALITDIHIRFY